MITLKDNDTGAVIGEISEDQLQALMDTLVEESEEDQDYWINRETLDLLRADGADEGLVRMIESAMGERDDIEIAWDEA